MWQTEHVAARLMERHPGLAIEIVGMTTKGDRILDRPLAQVGGKGLFIKELESALADNLDDIAVHSMKDVPSELPPGFCITAVLPRFTTVFHNAPISQDRTGGCWCFSGLSFFESEVHRLGGQEVRLSQMYVIYYEYIEKVRRFVQERGASRVSLGSEINAVPRMLKLYGVVPAAVYSGTVESQRYEHNPLLDEIEYYLNMVKEKGYWDEDQVIATVKLILNKHLGAPPESFLHEGRNISPAEYLHVVLKLNPDDYVVAMSALSAPFYTRARLDVPDNWWPFFATPSTAWR